MRSKTRSKTHRWKYSWLSDIVIPSILLQMYLNKKESVTKNKCWEDDDEKEEEEETTATTPHIKTRAEAKPLRLLFSLCCCFALLASQLLLFLIYNTYIVYNGRKIIIISARSRITRDFNGMLN